MDKRLMDDLVVAVLSMADGCGHDSRTGWMQAEQAGLAGRLRPDRVPVISIHAFLCPGTPSCSRFFLPI